MSSPSDPASVSRLRARTGKARTHRGRIVRALGVLAAGALRSPKHDDHVEDEDVEDEDVEGKDVEGGGADTKVCRATWLGHYCTRKAGHTSEHEATTGAGRPTARWEEL